MTDEIEDKSKIWEKYAEHLFRIKVDGGYLYQSHYGLEEVSMCFVPDIDLQRYQSHLRDAYKKGYQDGHEDEKLGITARQYE